jgi:Tol biopolymer transport system component
MKVPAAGGTPVEISEKTIWCLDASEDAQLLCYLFGPSGDTDVVLIPLAGGDPVPVTGIPGNAKGAAFGPDGRSITYSITGDGADEIWSIPAQGGAARLLARFEGKEIRDFAWSPDGKRLAIVKDSRSGDVVLLKRAAPR